MSKMSVGSRVRMELAKARLRDGWTPALGPEGSNRTDRLLGAASAQLRGLGQEVTRRDLVLTSLAASVAGLALGFRDLPGARQVPVGAAPPVFETPRSFVSSEDFPELDPIPLPGERSAEPLLAEAEPLYAEAAPPRPLKRPEKGIPRGPLFAERRLALVNENTGEAVNATYWAEGDYLLEGLEEIQVLLRDHHTDEIHAIDLKLVESLYRLSQTLDSQGPLHVLSAYRSPRTNARLALRYDGVAENSFHMKGKAVDLYIPGRRKRDLARAAQSLRVGGVGIYSSFVHVDTGPIRRWHS